MRIARLLSSMSQATAAFNTVCSYSPPSWCKHLKNIPTHKVVLAHTPTPIHPWKIPGLSDGIKLCIKRDDMTGAALSGNKIRKLEFLLGDAITNGYKSIITCGGIQSNHCRATVVAASQLGLKTHVLLRTDTDVKSIQSNGNLFLSQMCDANIYLVPRRAQFQSELMPKQEALAEEIFRRTGERAYSICIGGSNPVGLHGYLSAWGEMMEQGVQDDFDDVVVTCGSGGTIAGLAIGNYLTGSKVKVHAVSVSDDASYFHNHVDEMLQAVGLAEVYSNDIVDIIDGHKGAGYGLSTTEDHNLYHDIAAATGIFVDPVYTGKGIKGLMSELKSNRGRFQGDRILFIHTGGIFGLYDGRMFKMFEDDAPKLFDWRDAGKPVSEFVF